MPWAAWSVIAAWAAIGVALAGVGALVRRLLGRPATSTDDWLAGFWLGFAATICVLQAWQLAWPVDRGLLVGLGVVGLVGVAREGRLPWILLLRGLRRHAAAVAAFLLVLGWLALQALHGPRNGDSGLYHVPTIAWHLGHRLPPGLGNLAAPFAYNQSYFLWTALLETGPLVGRGTHVANTVLLAALLGRVGLGLSRLVRRAACPPADAFYALVLPGVLPLVLDVNATSPSPDIAVHALGIVLVGECLRLLTTGRRFVDLAALGLLAGSAPALKLSLGGLAAGTLAVAGAAWLRRRPRRPSLGRAATVLTAIGIVGPGTWMIRGVVLSGYPLYPSTLFAVPAEWAVPRETVVAEAKLIRYWNGVEGWWWAAWHDPAWFVRWLPTLGWLRADVLIPLGIAVTALLAVIGRRLLRPGIASAVPAPIVLPLLVSLAYCFAAAPRARYGASAYWMLASTLVWLALPARVLDPAGAGVRRLAAGIACGLAVGLVLARGALVPGLWDFEPHVRARVSARTLPSGLVVHDPGESMQCWDAPLPCSPFRQDALRLRVPGDLGAGFTVAPPH